MKYYKTPVGMLAAYPGMTEEEYIKWREDQALIMTTKIIKPGDPQPTAHDNK